MKRTILIVSGVAVVLLLIGVWAYILFTGTTSETVSFNDFGFGDTTDPTVLLPLIEETEPDPVAGGQSERLRQLTTKPVVGFAEILPTSTTSPVVVYHVEAGTGHIFSLDLDTREERRVSATTIPLATKAVLTPNGQHVLIQSDTGVRASFVIGTLSTSSDRMSNIPLDESIVSFAATLENQFVYAVTAGDTLVAKLYEPATGSVTTLFTIPFREATISWHHTAAGPHIVYPKATSRLEGYVYSYTNGVVSRLNASGYGLSAVGSASAIIYGSFDGEAYTSYSVGNDALVSVATPITLIPEKCRFTNTNSTVALCGVSFDPLPHLMPDPWYRGDVILNDSLWEYNTVSRSARLLVSPETATGRQVDLINPQLDSTDSHFYFQNKVDDTLWLYEYR